MLFFVIKILNNFLKIKFNLTLCTVYEVYAQSTGLKPVHWNRIRSILLSTSDQKIVISRKQYNYKNKIFLSKRLANAMIDLTTWVNFEPFYDILTGHYQSSSKSHFGINNLKFFFKSDIRLACCKKILS